MSKKKYVYLFVIQGKYDELYGWEDVTQDENYQRARSLLNDYMTNEPVVPHRMIKRRMLLDTFSEI